MRNFREIAPVYDQGGSLIIVLNHPPYPVHSAFMNFQVWPQKMSGKSILLTFDEISDGLAKGELSLNDEYEEYRGSAETDSAPKRLRLGDVPVFREAVAVAEQVGMPAPVESRPPALPDDTSTGIPSSASGWRAFFSVFLTGLYFAGLARPEPEDVENAVQLRQFMLATSALALGTTFAALFVIKWRALGGFWRILWRLHLVTITATFLAGLLHGPVVAGAAIAAALIYGLAACLAGIALFYWRNVFTNILLSLLGLGASVGLVKSLLAKLS